MTLLKATVLALMLANAGYFLWARDLSSNAPAGADSVTPARGTAPLPAIRLASEGAPLVAADNHGRANDKSDVPPVPVDAPAPGSAGAATPGITTPVTNAPGATAVSAETGSPPATDAALLSDVKRCISIGPFRDVAEASRAATTLRASGYGPRQRVAEGEVWAGVWVYLPRPERREAVDQILAKLRKAAIEDALEMPGPNEAPVVSLGLFSEPKRAQMRVAQAQAVGLNPLITDRKRSGNVFWVDIDLKSTDGLMNPADLQGEAGRIVRLEVKACPAN